MKIDRVCPESGVLVEVAAEPFAPSSQSILVNTRGLAVHVAGRWLARCWCSKVVTTRACGLATQTRIITDHLQ